MVGAVEDRHTGEPPAGQRRPDRLGQDLAIDDAWDVNAVLVGEQRRHRQLAQALARLVRAAGLDRERLAGRLGVSQRLLVERERAALDDRPLEQPSRAAGDQLGQDRQAAGRLACDGDVVRVAAEPADVVLHPAQRRLLVHQPVVARRAAGPRSQRRVGQEPQHAEPVVDRDDHDAVGRQFGAVIVAAGVFRQRAAMDPHQDRPPGVAARRRRVHVEVQAILASGAGRQERVRVRVRVLRAARREAGGVADAMPAGRWPRGAPAQVPDGGSGVGQSEILLDGAPGHGRAADGAVTGGHDQSGGPRGRGRRDGLGSGDTRCREGQRGQRRTADGGQRGTQGAGRVHDLGILRGHCGSPQVEIGRPSLCV